MVNPSDALNVSYSACMEKLYIYVYPSADTDEDSSSHLTLGVDWAGENSVCNGLMAGDSWSACKEIPVLDCAL